MGDTILSSMEKQFARYGLDLASWSVLFMCSYELSAFGRPI